MVTFPVDDVTLASEALPTRPLGALFPDALVTDGDPGTPMVEPGGEFAHLETGRLDALWVPVPATPVREASDADAE
ncbi:hypothetical protein [Plantactinospora sonchi]|uniref:Uncharacterized protein n=1 Tax=Plantactinospora sonchi TaxID=1544735 RepID=A0ABU7RMY4_9ACTN